MVALDAEEGVEDRHAVFERDLEFLNSSPDPVRRSRDANAIPLLTLWDGHRQRCVESVYHPRVRRIRLTFVDTGESVLADLLEGDAPETCELIWGLLPAESKAIHGMYSGAEVFTLVEAAPESVPENLVQLPLPGELLYFYDEGRGAAGARRPVGEICFVYGRGVVLRAHEGVPTQATLFARIPGDWKTDWTAFAAACRRCRWEGPQRLRIEQAD